VIFRITHHSGFAAPPDALDLLWQRLDSKYDDTRFTRVGTEIRATWGNDAPITIERDEREAIGRRVILDIVFAVCERAPELKSDWFAVCTPR
jgi:hypothetical protein